MTAMDGANISSALDQRDVSLVRWYLSSPSSVAAVLRTPCRKHNNNDDDEALASRLASSIPAHLQFFATVVMDFGPFHVPTEEENQRFDALQHIYHDLSENTLPVPVHDASTPSPTIMRLSPRMIVDYAEPKSKRRDALGKVVNEHLDTLAREVEGQLLDEVDKETSKRHSKEERDRRRRRAKKKNRRAKRKDASDESDVESSPSSDVEKATSCDDENVTPNEGCNRAVSDDVKNLTKGRGGNDQMQITAVKNAKDLHKTPASCGESEQLSSNGEAKSKKISYLAAAAKVPKIKSRPKPSVAAVTHPLPRPSADGKQPHAAQTNESIAETEQEEISRLQEQLESQRRGHLDLIQQVQLKAYIAENKAAMAIDRSRHLERQILDATYPEIEATRVESSSVKGLSPRKVKSTKATRSDKSKTKEDLELELRSERRASLAMMNRVQMRTFLAETKAKAAEQRSQQLEKLLRDAQKGEEFG